MLRDEKAMMRLGIVVFLTFLSLSIAAQAESRWRPHAGDTWQWQLKGTVNTRYNVDVYDIDLFDVPQTVVERLKGDGRRVVCYFSAGSAEDWRLDYNLFRPEDLGAQLSGWAGERWLDTRSISVRTIMRARLDIAVRKGCDGVEPDNLDGYTRENRSGLPLTYQTALDYHQFLVDEAHARGLAIGLKNDLGLIPQLAKKYDFAVNEECHAYNECEAYGAFTALDKPVFNVEYDVPPHQLRALCARARASNLRTLVLPLELNDRFRFSCDAQ